MQRLSAAFLFSLLLATALAKTEKKPTAEEESNAIDDNNDDGADNDDDKAEARISSDDKAEPNADLSNGFGTDINWVHWPEAVSVALDLDRPILLLIHKTWCGACTALKKSFSTSSKRSELVELSRRFVMVNVEDDDEPEEDEYAPDGRYIPRLFILDKKGQPLPVDNAKNYPNNKQYFPQAPDVIRAMKQGLELFKGETSGKKEEKEEPKVPEDDPKAGGCPHMAAKVAKKAAEEAKRKEKEEKGKVVVDEKKKEKKKSGGKENATGKEKEKKTPEKVAKEKEELKKKKKEKAKEEL